ncbi:MAG TPA: homocitrate synthase family protein [Methanolinea sp.]|jgi:methanogen homocitrate synthase|nr:homocitrate synthase family protein [Methanolinea sp.]HPC54645.1 homocitrate synthase family protein [Methanolinea sp.]HQE85610.1 homocitrate synthase family protein [Methanolinea sp.]HQI14457.1 homocitrate synthase family protein [Methanolinea sp.]HQJ18875.1 homocitrate synthase family protein [Methanolinea sp.]
MKSWHIEICDVTLRDGEQTPGVSFTCEEKVRIAEVLDQIGVEVIEAGFPATSSYEKRCVSSVAALDLDARICCLARARKGDVDAAIDAGVDMVSIFIPTSELHVRHKFHAPREKVLADALEMVDYTRDHGLQVRFAAEDASRTDLPFLLEVYRQGEEHGADLLSFADTVGALSPLEMYRMMRKIVRAVKKPLCAHCHNDMGMATANTIAAAQAGAFQLHTTVNGIGERAGNAALEEVLVALYMKGNIRRYDLSHLTTLSAMVAQYSGIPVDKLKPVVGEHAFRHESGIHIAAILEDPSTYEYFPPGLVGATRKFTLGKHTGKKALEHEVARLGYSLPEKDLCRVLELVKDRGEKKVELTDETLIDLIKMVMGGPPL